MPGGVGRVGVALTAKGLLVASLVILAIGGAVYYWVNREIVPQKRVLYPAPKYLLHVRDYYMPDRKHPQGGSWSNDFSVFGANRWVLSDVGPDGDMLVQLHLYGSMRILARVDNFYRSNSNIEFCHKLYDLKIKLDPAMRKGLFCE